MEIAGLAILVVIVGALLWLGWSLAPFIFVALFLYVVFRYHRDIPKVVRAVFAEFRKIMKK